MAVDFDILSITPDLETLGGTATRPVYLIMVRTKPHNVVIGSTVPREGYVAREASDLATSLTRDINYIFEEPAVADVAWSYEQTPAGQLTPHLTIFVSSSSGFSSGVLGFNYPPMLLDHYREAAAELRAQLDASEAA